MLDATVIARRHALFFISLQYSLYGGNANRTSERNFSAFMDIVYN